MVCTSVARSPLSSFVNTLDTLESCWQNNNGTFPRFNHETGKLSQCKWVIRILEQKKQTNIRVQHSVFNMQPVTRTRRLIHLSSQLPYSTEGIETPPRQTITYLREIHARTSLGLRAFSPAGISAALLASSDMSFLLLLLLLLLIFLLLLLEG